MRRLPRITFAVMVLVVGVLAILAWNLRTPANDPRADAIRQQGYPITLAELDDWYRRPPERENAALIYTNAFARIALASNVFERLKADTWIPKRGQAIDSEEKAELTSILSTNQETLRLLYSAATLTNSRYPIDLTLGFNTLLPHLAQIKGATLILTSEAMLLASDHENERAVEALLAAGPVADSICQEPLLISQLVNCASWKIICSRLEWTINAGTFTPQQLTRLQTMIAGGESGCFVRGLVGERASGYAIFTDPKAQVALLGFSGVSPATATWQEQLRAQLLFGLLKTSGMLKKDKTFYLDAMSTNVAIARLPFPDRFKMSQITPVPNPPGRLYVISSIMLPALTKAGLRDTERAARMRVTETALAVERFRRANSNRLPDNLDQLLPAFMAAVPNDPYGGKSLRYKKREPGYVVYSIGSDERDDGGMEYDKEVRTAPSDITFILDH